VQDEPIHHLVQIWGYTDQRSGADLSPYQAMAVAAKRQLPSNRLGLYILDAASGTYRGVAIVGEGATPRSIPGLRLASEDQEKHEIESLLSEQTKTSLAASQLSAFHKQGRNWHVLGLRYRYTPYAFIAAAGRDN
jgi:hypothetical protein